VSTEHEGSPTTGGDAPASAPAAAWRRLHPNSVVVGQRLGFGITAMVALAAFVGVIGGIVADRPAAWVKLLLAFGWLALSASLGWLSWTLPLRHFRHTRYRVDPLGLLIHRGRMFHSEVAVARSRIQHTDLSQGPIQRAFGIASLTIHTAGTEDAKIELEGIGFDEAQRLRNELTGQTNDDVV
jgi:membrane protein YdbS with pleckstrin-like domain